MEYESDTYIHTLHIYIHTYVNAYKHANLFELMHTWIHVHIYTYKLSTHTCMRARRSNLHSWMMQCVVVCCSMLQVMRCIAVQIKPTHIYAGTTLESAQLDDGLPERQRNSFNNSGRVARFCSVSHWNTLQHNAADCNTLNHTATCCDTLQHTATHCNTLQHTTTTEALCITLKVTDHCL